MPTYSVTSPDGRKFKVTAPEGATQEEVLAYAQQNMPAAAPPEAAPRNEKAALFRQNIPTIAGGPLLPDALFGIRQGIDALAQHGARGVEWAAGKLGVGQDAVKRERERIESINKDALNQYTANFDPENTPGSGFGRGVGNAVLGAAVVPAAGGTGIIRGALGGASVGAGSSLLQPIYDAPGDQAYADELKKRLAIGAVAGGALGTAAGVIGKSAPTKEAADLMDKGVRVTPGRAAGGAAGRIEEGAESIPLVGDVVRGSARRAVEDFNRATINKVLEPIGQTLTPKTLGRHAVSEARKKISAAYESVLDDIGRVDLDRQFSDEGTKIAGMTAELGESAQKQFLAILKNRVFDRITPAGTVSATTMKTIDSDLGRLGSGFLKSQDPNTRGLGMALLELQTSLRNNVARSAGPELAERVQAANEAYKGWIRVADASTRAGSKEGVFSPAALRAASMKADKVGFREGNAVLQDWAERAEKVLGPKVPDSGTPYRLLGSAGLGGFFVDPSIAATGAAITMPYLFPRATAAMTRHAGDVSAAAPYLGLAVPGLLGIR